MPATVSLDTTTNVQVVIPARLASTRLPEKLLLKETGKSVLQHTYEAACGATTPAGIVIAVDHPRLLQNAHSFGADAVMTNPDLPSGTDRVAAVAKEMEDVDIFVNVQGDEPEIEPSLIDQVARLLIENPNADITTMCAPIREREKLEDPACVKVVFGNDGRAMYFSRCPIPHARSWSDDLLQAGSPVFFQHIGLYAYRRRFLMRLDQLPHCPLESVEKLEQLRFLSAGTSILVGQTDSTVKGIDTSDDYRKFVHRFYQSIRTAA
ncbi:MAG TPA: 3-deoxy-manno-octulosonate cytidylyltransferase [Planctomycetaceae bacterium]|nr:3-deoxy-manno-octulosonate cytidylyltransferase [Planctomycetaceae bacterium]